MEKRIQGIRDAWIDQFKNTWDGEIKKIQDEKNRILEKIELDHKEKIKELSDEKDNRIRYVKEQCENNIKIENGQLKHNKKHVEKVYEKKLQEFLNNNIKKESIQDIISSYVLKWLNRNQDNQSSCLYSKIETIEPYPFVQTTTNKGNSVLDKVNVIYAQQQPPPYDQLDMSNSQELP
jgi:hypothetical protein